MMTARRRDLACARGSRRSLGGPGSQERFRGLHRLTIAARRTAVVMRCVLVPDLDLPPVGITNCPQAWDRVHP